MERASPFAAIRIDAGIPAPSAREGRLGNLRSTYHALKLGHSFVYPDAGNLQRTQKRAGASNSYYSAMLHAKFISRIVTEDGKRVIRCWRVK